MFNIKERLGQIKLKTKLSMAFIAILIIPSLIVGVSSYNKAKTDLNETILQSAKDNISILDKIVDDELENKHTDITHFAKVLTQGIIILNNRKMYRINLINIYSYIQR